jgi:hypothetical protein
MLLANHKGNLATVRSWAALFAACRSAVVQSLCASPARSTGEAAEATTRKVPVNEIVKPFADVLQRYFEAGPALVVQSLECLLSFDLLYSQGALRTHLIRLFW